jgi:hypothetical protein
MIQFPAETQDFSFLQSVQTGSGDTQPPIQWIKTALSLKGNQPGSEADHSPPSNDKFKNELSYTSILPNEFMASTRTN